MLLLDEQVSPGLPEDGDLTTEEEELVAQALSAEPAPAAAKPAPAPTPTPAPTARPAAPTPTPVAARPAAPTPSPTPVAAKPAAPTPAPTPVAARPAAPTPAPTPVAARPAAPTPAPTAARPAPTAARPAPTASTRPAQPTAPVAAKPTPTPAPVAAKPAPTPAPVAAKPAPEPATAARPTVLGGPRAVEPKPSRGSLPSGRPAAPVSRGERVDDEPTAPGPGAAVSPSAGFSMLIDEEPTGESPSPAGRADQESSLDRAARLWEEEEVSDHDAKAVDSLSPPPSVEGGFSGSMGFALLPGDDEDLSVIGASPGPAVYIDDSPDEPTPPPRPRVEAPPPEPPPPEPLPAREVIGGPAAGNQPLRVFVGGLNGEGNGGRRRTPPEVGGQVFDAAVTGFSRFDTDELFGEDAETEDARPADEEPSLPPRAPGELPRTWLDPHRLPPALDRYPSRPRRVGGNVQAVPGTPSALAIAREEAEAARFGPPPPLPSTGPPLGMGWASLESEDAAPAPAPADRRSGQGFQLVTDAPQAANAPRVISPMVVSDSAAASLVTERLPGEPAARPATPAPEPQSRLVPILVFLLVLAAVVGGAVYYLRTPGPVGVHPVPEPVNTGIEGTEGGAEAGGEGGGEGASGAETPSTPAASGASEAPPAAATPASSGGAGASSASSSGPTRVAGSSSVPAATDSPRAEVGLLKVTSNRQGTVYVNGQKLGPANPRGYELPVGSYKVEFVPTSGRKQTRQIRVDPGRPIDVAFSF